MNSTVQMIKGNVCMRRRSERVSVAHIPVTLKSHNCLPTKRSTLKPFVVRIAPPHKLVVSKKCKQDTCSCSNCTISTKNSTHTTFCHNCEANTSTTRSQPIEESISSPPKAYCRQCHATKLSPRVPTAAPSTLKNVHNDFSRKSLLIKTESLSLRQNCVA